MNSKKTVFAKVIIIFVGLLLLILPQSIGKTPVTVQSGTISSYASLNGMKAGIPSGEDTESIIKSLFPSSVATTYEDVAQSVDALLNKECDYIVCKMEEAETITEENQDLLIIPFPINSYSVTALDEGQRYYPVIRKADYSHGITQKKRDDCLQKGVTIAVLNGVSAIPYLEENYPDVKVNVYNTNSDVLSALHAKKCDYAIFYATDVDSVLNEYPDFAIVYEPLSSAPNCFTAPKTERGEKIVKEFNEFVQALKDSGEYDALINKWDNGDESNYKLDSYTFSGENGKLSAVTCGTWVPKSFYYNNELIGTYPELLYRFAAQYGYTPSIATADYSAELAGVTSGAYDFMADISEATPEREKSVIFTVPIQETSYMLYAIADPAETEYESKFTHFIDGLGKSFKNTFLVQERYKMILDGLGVTLLIAVSAAVLGTLLGVLICYLRMSKHVFPCAFAQIYIKVVQGMPIVVFLMILYYIVFAKTSLPTFWIAVIGFSIDFSAYVSEIFRSGIESVNPRQLQAARALGFNKVSAFIKVVLPQAMIRIIPVYSGQFISLVKITSVVGYIAIQDLTKVSDMIRSFTYEAFFPLIATAVIYFLLSSLLLTVLKAVERKIDPSIKPRRVKGVHTDAH